MKRRKIAIDAGHGGHDPGAVGKVYREKHIALLVAFKLKAILAPFHDVIMTRSDDIYVSLDERCRIANNAKADIFISIHCNSANVDTANGIETFHHPTSKNGIKLASLVQPELIEKTGLRNRGIKYANFYVLQHTAMPAVLCEIGFINNPSEEVTLGTELHQDLCAEAIFNGIQSYFN